jgi:DNA-directed RNA polymerase specialized sigma24 family protein
VADVVLGDRIGAADEDDLAVCLIAAGGGDEVGFAAVWRSLQPAVLRYLRVLVGGAAEDVASKTWLQAARDLGSFEGGLRSFRVWLFRIARHRVWMSFGVRGGGRSRVNRRTSTTSWCKTSRTT